MATVLIVKLVQKAFTRVNARLPWVQPLPVMFGLSFFVGSMLPPMAIGQVEGLATLRLQDAKASKVANVRMISSSVELEPGGVEAMNASVRVNMAHPLQCICTHVDLRVHQIELS